MKHSFMKWLLSSSAQLPVAPRTTITKRELLAIVASASVMFTFCPTPLKIFRDIGVILFILWLSSVLFDLWMAIPPLVIDLATRFCNSKRTCDNPSSWTLGCTLEDAAEMTREVIRQAKATVVSFLVTIRMMIVNVLRHVADLVDRQQRQAEHADDTKDADEASRAVPRAVQFYGLLIRRPAVHRYGPISDHFPRQVVPPEPIIWENHGIPRIPDMVSSLSFRTHLSFALIEASVWTSRSLALSQKLRHARCWDISGGNKWDDDFRLSEHGIKTIIGIDNLGLIDAGDDVVGICQKYSNQIFSEWKNHKYLNIWWNDIDYALILAALVVGRRADARVEHIFKVFHLLRIEEVTSPRMDKCKTGFMGGWSVAMISGVATVISGGVLAPVTIPLFLGGWATSAGTGIAAAAIGSGENSKWKRRVLACRYLVCRFPQLKAVLNQFIM